MPIDPDTWENAWQDVQANWDDSGTHRRFMELSRLAQRLPQAGQRYRDVRDHDPLRRDAACKHIDQLLGVAMQAMHAQRATARPPRRRLLWGATLLTSLLLLYVVSTLLRSD